MTVHVPRLPEPIIAGPQEPPIAAVGRTLAVHEWSMPGPSYLHIHRSDDEGWHVLDGVLRFHLADGTFDAPAGTTVFLPAGTAHTYSCPVPSRYLIFLTPCLERLTCRRLLLTDQSEVAEILAEHDTEIVA